VKESRINILLTEKNTNILSIYYTAGFPALDDTVGIGERLAANGADILEIGIPFSDPVADGPVIQDSSKVALDNGMTLKLLLKQVKVLRSKVTTPIILMGYFNPILQFGVDEFCAVAAEAGVDGLIIPDLPLQEYQDLYEGSFEQHGLQNVFLISPTTSEERIKLLDEGTNGFIYAVSSSSTTGSKKGFTQEQQGYFARLQKMKLKNPFLIGFGVSNHETFTTVCRFSAGAIIGSAFIAMLKQSKDIEGDIGNFINEIKGTK